nr:YggS family pyridoxal phosphate-dependent enzyme [Deltaproteobacteria bacterium]
ACRAAGRDPAEVTLVAVSKTHPVEAIRAAAAAGATDFGENYAQELVTKRAGWADSGSVRWHYIGRLQRNKAKLVAGQVVLVHAVDTLELAAELAKRAAPTVQSILLAVNVAGELTKGGVAVDDVPTLARAIAAVPGVRLDGLMTLPPPSDDPAASRPAFEALRDLRDGLEQNLSRPLPVLSMGMSGDYEVAIACGATHVRIGTAIFGSR